MNPSSLLVSRVQEHRRVAGLVQEMVPDILAVGQELHERLRRGRRVYICGNGGSAADAQHFSAELTGRFATERKGFPAVALTTDTSALTAIGNDYGFDQIFSRQLESLATEGDYLVVISTSGNSENLIAAVKMAEVLGVTTMGLLGRDGGRLANSVDRALIIPVQPTARIQEAHILIIHLLCEMFEPE